jgi:hypothetical protein
MGTSWRPGRKPKPHLNPKSDLPDVSGLAMGNQEARIELEMARKLEPDIDIFRLKY